MSKKNTQYAVSGAVVQLTQDTLTTGGDSRVWRDLADNSYYVTDDRRVSKRDALGVVTSTPEITDALTGSEKMTICLNRQQDYLFILTVNGSAQTSLYRVATSGMEGSLTLININIAGVTPVRAIISFDDKLWFLGQVLPNTKRLYKVDLDGSNGSFVDVYGTVLENTFCMNSENKAFTFSNLTNPGGTGGISPIFRTTVAGNGDLQTELYDGGIANLQFYTSLDSFTSNGFCYFLMTKRLNGLGIKIVKVPILTWDSEATYEQRDLTSDFGIEDECTQLFSDGVYGYFYENNGIDTFTMWRFDPDTLDCEYLIDFDLPNRQFEWSPTGTPATIHCDQNANNCDPAALMVSADGPTGGV